MAAKTTSRPGRARTAPTLPGLVLDLVRAAGRPLTVKELSEAVVRAKFPTTSRNVAQLVKSKVGGLVKRGLLRRADGQPGVVPGKAQAAKPASAAKARPTTQAADRNGQAAPKAVTPAQAAKPAQGHGKVALGDLLLRLLAKSSRPLKARELAEQALAAGYQTASKDFTGVVWVGLGKLKGVQNVPGQGYRLKARPAKAK